MTAVSAPRPAGRAQLARPLSTIADTAVVTRRNLRHIRRTFRLLAVSAVQPVMFVLLFRYVFGGAIRPPGISYIDYLLPGIFVSATLFGATTAVAMAEDLSGGMIDRFRSLPMARSAVLAGRCLADAVRSVIVVAIVILVGTLTGFRFHNGVVPAIAAIGLVLAFGFAFTWLYALIGLLVGDSQTAQLAGFLPVFLLVFASSVFVPVQTMPGWLQAFAKAQPVSVTVNTVRSLAEGGPVTHWAWQSAAWIVGFIGVFGSLAVAKYRKA
jgi:ABC-2 type transport system permease protein/oleandomycin transport system permease protein